MFFMEIFLQKPSKSRDEFYKIFFERPYKSPQLQPGTDQTLQFRVQGPWLSMFKPARSSDGKA